MADQTVSRGTIGSPRAVYRTHVQLAALTVGIVFLVVGIAGFIPGITTNYDEMEFAGHESMAELFGVFKVSILHNIVHILFGVAGIAAARTWTSSRWFLIGGGVVYLVLWIFGLIVDDSDDANFVPVNDADDWLHFGLGVGMIALGLLLTRHRADRYVIHSKTTGTTVEARPGRAVMSAEELDLGDARASDPSKRVRVEPDHRDARQ